MNIKELTQLDHTDLYAFGFGLLFIELFVKLGSFTLEALALVAIVFGLKALRSIF